MARLVTRTASPAWIQLSWARDRPAATNWSCSAGLKVSDIDVVEANEAFAAQANGRVQGLDFDNGKTNPTAVR